VMAKNFFLHFDIEYRWAQKKKSEKRKNEFFFQFFPDV